MSALNQAPQLSARKQTVDEYAIHEPTTCFHCGLPTSPNARLQIKFNGVFHAVCCIGCEAVVNTIISAGLGNYYVTRTAAPNTSAPFELAEIDVAKRLAAFDLPTIQPQYLTAASADKLKSAAFYIDGVTCNACLWLAEAALKQVPGVAEVSVNYVTHRAEVAWQPSENTPTSPSGMPGYLSTIVEAIARVGLRAIPVASHERQALRVQARRESLKQLGVALLAMMQVMMFTVPLYFASPGDVSPEATHLMQWASLLLTLPVVVYSARPFWVGAWRDAHTRHLSMDTPIAIAIASTFITSMWSLTASQNVMHSALYFDSITMFVFLLLAARYLEAGIRDRALSRIERLTNAAPAVAQKLMQYPDHRETFEVASADLCKGDVILIPTGQMIAADSILLEGASEVDESIITGESVPAMHAIGASLLGGTLNLGSPLIARVERVGSASTLASMARLAEYALGERPPLMVLADRVARVVAPALVGLAVAAGVIWLFIDSTQSFNVAVAVLAVTCPCAIALAAPLAYASATLSTANAGLLISRGHVLETLPQLTDVVFDKTGTLTTGKLAITRIETHDDLDDLKKNEVLAIAAALEMGAAHPIAQSINRIVRNRNSRVTVKVATQISVVAGGGVQGIIDADFYRFGHRHFACADEVDAADTASAAAANDDAFVLSRNGAWLATFHADDTLKADALATVQALQYAGLRVHLVSGDRAARVNQVAVDLGIESVCVRAQQTPLQKLLYIERLQAHGRKVGMIGDGVNDAPMLGAADVSIAMAAGADLPRLTADAVLLSPYLATIAATLNLACRTRRIIKQNFAWAIAYNAIGIPLAVANVINPAWAAIGMGVSGLVVVLNSMRLLKAA